MQYVVSLSGGVSSAVSADLAIKRYGREKVRLWFADTLWEDPDLHRFMADCMARWGGRLYTFEDGRTPPQVAEDKHIIPNNLIRPCTFELKIKPFGKWLIRQPRPVTVLLGLSWSEMHRIDKRRYWHRNGTKGPWKRPTGWQAKIPGVYEDFPLLWKPIVYDVFDYCRNEMRIEIPYLYRIGLNNNNCGGRCFAQSITGFMILRNEIPESFAWLRDWEQKMRGKYGDHSILKDQSGDKNTTLTLLELEKRKRVRRQKGDDLQMTMFEDMSGCLCEF